MLYPYPKILQALLASTIYKPQINCVKYVIEPSGRRQTTSKVRQTIKLKPALKLLQTVADPWKPAQNQEFIKRGPSQQRPLKGKGEKLQLQAGHGVPQPGRKRPNNWMM